MRQACVLGKEPACSSSFKSRCMRNLFIALDGPDAQFASEELSRTKPTINADETLKDRRAQRCELGSTHLMLERHPIFVGTTTQVVISLSSRESEFDSAVRGACRTLELAALMLDLSFTMQAELRTDNTAAKGLASRRGARHIHCPALWLQQGIARR